MTALATTKRTEATTKRTEALALTAVDDLNLRGHIVRWNVGEEDFSFLHTWDGFMSSLALEKQLGEALFEMADEADRRRLRQFMPAVQKILASEIKETFEVGLHRKFNDWATKIAASRPTAFLAPAPFPSAAAWASWCTSHLELPCVCGPQAEDIAPDGVVLVLARFSLESKAAIATKSGWIVNPIARAGKKAVQPLRRQRGSKIRVHVPHQTLDPAP